MPRANQRRKALTPRQVAAFERCRETFSYNPDTGLFHYLVRKGRSPAGSQAGWLDNNGYLIIEIARIRYKAHRLAWYFIHGKMPENDIDHINGKKDDNRIENLRECVQTENTQNIATKTTKNKTGFVGVYFNKRTGRFYSQIVLNGRCYNLGHFDTAEEAFSERMRHREILHPFAIRA